jgi:hypothetical protein
VLLPKSNFNKGRNKLFFFWSQDILSRTDPGSVNQRRMPTALERRGDFSQTFDRNGNLVVIYDPLTTRPNPNGSGFIRDPFPGNVIPANRLSRAGVAITNLFPKPDVDRSGANGQATFTDCGPRTVASRWPSRRISADACSQSPSGASTTQVSSGVGVSTSGASRRRPAMTRATDGPFDVIRFPPRRCSCHKRAHYRRGSRRSGRSRLGQRRVERS